LGPSFLAGLVLLVVPGILLAARFALFGFQNAPGGGVLQGFKQSADRTQAQPVDWRRPSKPTLSPYAVAPAALLRKYFRKGSDNLTAM
jgi:hypothetical protein